MKLSREQAEAFLATLWPCGHMSNLDNPTRTFLSALIGRVPSVIPYSRSTSAEDCQKMSEIAAILRSIAGHFEETHREAEDRERAEREPRP